MKAINIELTKWQTEILAPLFDSARAAFSDGKPVGIFAQVWRDVDKEKPGFMTVRVIDGETCTAIQSLNGVKDKPPDGKARTVTILQPD